MADGHSNNSIGGFVGMMNGQENDISFSYANAILNYSSSLSDFGCFTGLIIGDPNNITASYYNYEICNLSDNYATPKTTNDLQTLSTYINDGWQICGYNGGDIWHLQSGNLPCLSNAVGCGACQ